MEEEQEFIRLIDDIYDAALDSSRWTGALTRIAEFSGGQAAALLSKDTNSIRQCLLSGRNHPHFVQLYSETYWKLDPIAATRYCEVEQIVSVPDLIPYDEFRAGRFYREWVQPQGWIDAASTVLEKTATGCAYFTVIRSERSGMVDDEMRRRMRLVVPHVRRAVRTGKVIDLRQAEAATFADILDGLSPAIFLVDADGQILHCNAASRDVLDKGGFLRAVHGRLTACDAQIDGALHEALAAARDNDAECGGKASALSLTGRDGGRLDLPLSRS